MRRELRALLQHVVVFYPDTSLGKRIRLRYWGKRLRNRKLRYIGYGARIHGCDLLQLGTEFTLGDHAQLIIADSDPVYIGSNVAIAADSYIRSANHKFDELVLPIASQGHSSRRMEYKGGQYSIVIEDDVWVGAKAIILTGAFIGTGSVVSAGSVVSSQVPAFSIVVGNPARVVANRRKMAESKQVASD